MKKLFVITGTSSGLGFAIGTKVLEKKNCWVFGVSRRQTIHHAQYKHFALDLINLADTDLTYLASELINSEATHVVLINNAGVINPIDYIGEIDGKAVLDSFQVNCISPFLITNELVRQCLEKGVPLDVINIGSGASSKPIDGWTAYCSSKAALSIMTKVWAVEAKKRQWPIRFIEFSPGVIDTDMQKLIRGTSIQSFSQKEQFTRYYVEGKLEAPEITAQKILDLLRDQH